MREIVERMRHRAAAEEAAFRGRMHAIEQRLARVERTQETLIRVLGIDVDAIQSDERTTAR